MRLNVEKTLPVRALTAFLSLSASIALAVLMFRVIRLWSGYEYIGDDRFYIFSYITYHYIDVKLLPIFVLCAATIVGLYWISRKTGKQLLPPKIIAIQVLFIIFLFAAYVVSKLASPADRLVSATTFSDKELVALFDLKNPALDAVRASYEKQDYQGAKDRLLNYFEAKYKLYPEAVHERAEQQKILGRANLALEHSFTIKGRTKTFLDHVDWHQGFESDREWVYLLNRTYWFDDLVAAYLQTGDAHYIDEFSRQFEGWIRSNPLPLWKNERNPGWRLIDVGIRPYGSWIETFKLLVNAPSVDDATKLLLLKSLHDHAQFLFYFQTRGTNHVLIESRGLLKLANEFPEFKRARRWREVAIKRLVSEAGTQVYPDGGHVELSPDYQFHSLNHFAYPLRQVLGPQLHIASQYQDKVEAMREFLFYTLKPDLRLPLLNDTNTKDISSKLIGEARTDQRGDFLFIVTHGKEGVSPPVRSRAFENSGVYVMRSDWKKSGQYLIFDAGPYGGWHGHEDKLSFELSAHGTPMIIDGGAYRYTGDELNRAYFVSSAAHNTILIDGHGQSRRLLEYSNRPERADEAEPDENNLWTSDGEIDFVSGVYRDGYSIMSNAGSDNPVVDKSVTHRRDIVYIKNDYFIVADTISGSGVHEVELLFHLPPESLPRILTKSVNVRYQNGATLKLLSRGGGQLNTSIIIGQKKPIQGWFSSEKFEAVPAPVVSLKYTTELPATFYTLLAPSPPEGVSGNRFSIENFTVLEEGCGTGEVCLEVTSSTSVDGITIRSSDIADRLESSKETYKGNLVGFERRVRETGADIWPHTSRAIHRSSIDSAVVP